MAHEKLTPDDLRAMEAEHEANCPACNHLNGLKGLEAAITKLEELGLKSEITRRAITELRQRLEAVEARHAKGHPGFTVLEIARCVEDAQYGLGEVSNHLEPGRPTDGNE